MTGQILFGIKPIKNWKENSEKRKDPTFRAFGKRILEAKTKEEAIEVRKEADAYWAEKKAKETAVL